MKKVWDIAISILISPEVLAIVATFAAFEFFGEPLQSLASRLKDRQEPIKWLSLLPVGLLINLVRDRSSLLFPKGAKAQLFQEWPLYWMLPNRYFISVVMTLACAVTTVVFWVFAVDLSIASNLGIFIGAILVSVIASSTHFIATFTLRRILK
jgi:hypothetical protein